MLIYSAQYLKNTHPPTTTLKVIKIAKKKDKTESSVLSFLFKKANSKFTLYVYLNF